MSNLVINEYGKVECKHYSVWFDVDKNKANVMFFDIRYDLEVYGEGTKYEHWMIDINTSYIRKALEENGVGSSDKMVMAIRNKIEKVALELHGKKGYATIN